MEELSIYIFSDVLENVYIVVVYVCYVYEDGNIIIWLIMLKLRFVLLKVVSIFRLEFLGVFIGLWLIR